MSLVLGKHFLAVKEVLEILLEVDCVLEHIDYQPIHGQKCLFGHLTELKMYQILFGYVAKT